MWHLLSTFQWTTSNSVAVNHKVSVTTRPKARTWMCVSDVRGSEITNINTCSSRVIPQWFRKKQSRKKKKKLHKRGLIKADLPRAHDIHELHSASHKHTPIHTHSPLSKRKWSQCGRGIMLDLWSRSCSMLVILKLWGGLSLAAGWILFSLLRSLTSFTSLFVCSPLSWKSCGMNSWNKAGNKLTVGRKSEPEGLNVKRTWQ